MLRSLLKVPEGVKRSSTVACSLTSAGHSLLGLYIARLVGDKRMQGRILHIASLKRFRTSYFNGLSFECSLRDLVEQVDGSLYAEAKAK